MIARWRVTRRITTMMIIWIVTILTLGIADDFGWLSWANTGAIVSTIGAMIIYTVWQMVVTRRYTHASQQMATEGRMMILRPLPDANWGPQNAVQFWAQMSNLVRGESYIQLGVCGNASDMAYYLIAPNYGKAKTISHQLRGDYLGVQIETNGLKSDADPTVLPEGWHVYRIILKERDWKSPLQSKTNNPLTPLLSDLVHLGSDGKEEAKGGIVLSARSGFDAHIRAKKEKADATNPSKPKQSLLGKPQRTDQELVAGLSHRSVNPMLEAHIVIWGAAPTPDTAEQTARRLANQMTAQFIGRNSLKPFSADGKPLHKVKKPSFTSDLPTDYAQFDGVPMTDTDLALVMYLMGGATTRAVAPALRVAKPDTADDTGEIPIDILPMIMEGLQ